MTAEPRRIAVVRDYPALLEALRLRAVELKVNRKQIAEIAAPKVEAFTSVEVSVVPHKSLVPP